jgi:hypothetical protein
MVSALLAACSGLALLASSAWPMPPLRRREGAPGEASVVKRIAKTRLRARLGLGATFAALMLLATAVLTTWVPASKAPSKNNLVRVTTRTGSFCGGAALIGVPTCSEVTGHDGVNRGRTGPGSGSRGNHDGVADPV